MLFRIGNRCSYSILQVVRGYGHWPKLNLIFLKVAQEKVGGGGEGRRKSRIWRSGRQGSGPLLGRHTAHATDYSRISSSLLWLWVVAFCHGRELRRSFLHWRRKICTLYHSSEYERNAYLQAVPFVFKHSVMILPSQYTDIMPVGISAMVKCCFTVETDLDRGISSSAIWFITFSQNLKRRNFFFVAVCCNICSS